MKRLKEGTVRKVSWSKYWIVQESFFWLLDYGEKYWWCVIAEKWFKTDYGSIPRILWWIFNPTKYNIYILHDAMYQEKVKFHIWESEYEVITREEADKILLEWLKYEWAWFIERYCIYIWVRIWWWIAWYF